MGNSHHHDERKKCFFWGEGIGLFPHSHLVHDRSYDDDASGRVAKGSAPFRDGDAMLLHVLVLVDDHVFATDNDARWPVELVRMRCTLAPRYLQQHVGPWLRGL